MDRSRGFSLIELVATIIIVGVVAVVLLPRSANDDLVAATNAEQVAAAIRYAQSAAMSKGGADSGRRYRITFSATTYTFTYCNDASTAGCTNTVAEADPYSGQTGAVSLASGVTLTIPGTLPSSLIGFTALGVPCTNAAVSTALAANADIVVRYGSGARTVRVSPETGMVKLL